MKPRFLVLNLVLAGFLVFFHTSSYSAEERRVALVIGNGAYTSLPALRNPVNDAEDMARALESCGFTVIKKINADQREMGGAIGQFSQMLGAGGAALFYFAGHGVNIGGTNYLVPVKADLRTVEDAEFFCISASKVLEKMESAPTTANIMILDACRNNPFAGAGRNVGRGLARMEGTRESIILYATAAGSIADDGPGRNGLFTSNLLQHLRTPGLPLERVFKLTAADVRDRSNNKQVPWFSGSLTRDFFFVPAMVAAPSSPPAVVPDYNRIIREREEAEKQWAAWQGLMEAEFGKAEKYDRDQRLKPQDKVQVWTAFLTAYNQDNPFSDKDEAWRLKAKERLDYWQKQVQTASPAPSPTVAVVTPPAPPVTPPVTGPSSPPALPPTAPPSGVPDFDRIIREREQAERQWADWQVRLEAEYAKANQYDLDPRLKPQEKAQAWTAFLNAYSKNNPFSDKDEALRLKAQERLDSWRQQAAVPAPSPQVAAVTPSATDAARTLTGLLKYANGIIYDPNTNLEWYVGPDRA
ncbi:MAG: caspase family protein, partial [Pseudomonadota bacterium]